jgi:hypothetical protein
MFSSMNIIQLQVCSGSNEQNASVTEHAWLRKEQLSYYLVGFHPSTAIIRAYQKIGARR